MARFFLLGLLVLPIVEIAVFIKVGQTIGLFPTLALVIGAALLGGLLLRQQGVSVLMQLRGNVAAGRMPRQTIADAMLLGVAAVLLVLPGFLSDLVGLGLLLPPVRQWIYRTLSGRFSVVQAGGFGAQPRADDGRIKGPETIDLDDEDYRPR
ncbi:FxsA family protein [uncultured Devosia sp.]|uniref:FxsA family protein n=1 Tax=uncultured Devosia sp. TaxID=211434 RepID=UPI0035C9AF51